MAVVPANTDTAQARRCTRHPDRETLVSCGRCERPFCPQCLIHTPAGQRCFECAGVRRDYAQRAAARNFMAAFGALVIGGVVASVLGGLWGLVVAAIAGSAAGQAISPSVTRRSRHVVYALSALVLVLGAGVGWAVVPLIRFVTRAGFDPFVLVLLPMALAQSTMFWIFVLIAAIAAYARIR